MDVRRLINVAYMTLAEHLDPSQRENLDYELAVKFDHEMTPAELRREQYRREAIRIGAIQGQEDLMGAFSLGQAGA